MFQILKTKNKKSIYKFQVKTQITSALTGFLEKQTAKWGHLEILASFVKNIKKIGIKFNIFMVNQILKYKFK